MLLNAPELYIGLLSGTSADGIDAALVEFSEKKIQLTACHHVSYPKKVRDAILHLYDHDDLPLLMQCDRDIGHLFAEAALHLLQNANKSSSEITAIGSHGQTLRHYPQQATTLQIGDPNIIAVKTGIRTIADFRRKDIALGGQGAPLVPAFHAALFQDLERDTIILNLGGIANLSILFKDTRLPLIGFDTGPANALLDAWSQKTCGAAYDKDGKMAQSGQLHTALLEQLQKDAYFKKPFPKSTGREYFSLDWLHKNVSALPDSIRENDVAHTLCHLTALTIKNSITAELARGNVYVCGGGIHNAFLMECIENYLPREFPVLSTSEKGIDPDWVEAMAFAWLARQTHHTLHGNVPSVTGAKCSAILGGIYLS